ncbi:hypothetical protein AA106556_0506 [Neokomagataea tanensis NBRC 106556]|uniref:Uncharacterized protein n=1 Tax=Neokomagataea tanensis NBRC 106556 TaxID=1223519 RepID=A0ABQ0QH72_9PROT|nr:hypothetical protein AA106556_0506 [Neokomagataea tanensis NBRC 106556]
MSALRARCRCRIDVMHRGMWRMCGGGGRTLPLRQVVKIGRNLCVGTMRGKNGQCGRNGEGG